MTHTHQKNNCFLFPFLHPGVLQLLSATGSIFLASGGCEEYHCFWHVPRQAFPMSSPNASPCPSVCPVFQSFLSLGLWLAAGFLKD